MNNFLNGLTALSVIFSLIVVHAVVGVASAAPELGHHLTELTHPLDAPDFNLKDMDDVTHQFSDYRGKVVMINFWATWCAPCRREIPSMERIHKKFGSDNFHVLAINQTEDPDHVFAYSGQLEIVPTFSILFDRDSTVSQKYEVQGLPTTYLIDKKGKVRFRALGGREFDHPEVVKLIGRLIKE